VLDRVWPVRACPRARFGAPRRAAATAGRAEETRLLEAEDEDHVERARPCALVVEHGHPAARGTLGCDADALQRDDDVVRR
jgi:hypothetical protein